jgi:hypothetical protein
MEVGATAPLRGGVGPEPVVELITDTDIEQHGAVEAHPDRGKAHSAGIRIVERLEALVGHADITAQIPTTELGGRRRRVILGRRRDGHVCGKRHRRQQ